VLDAMRFVTGDFARLSAVIATQAKQWLDTGTDTWLDVTSPDNILVSGRLANGAVASSHVAAIPYAGSGYRMEIYGRDGTLVAAGEDSPQLNEVTLHGTQRGNTLAPIAVPAELTVASASTPAGEAFHVGQMYTAFARAIHGGAAAQPDFATAVEMHRLIDAIRHANDTGCEVETGA
jgi:predicted dehydrogenase